MSARTRNERRKLWVGMIDPTARLVLAAGLVKPIVSPGPDDVLTALGSLLLAIAGWSAAAYFVLRLEDEE